MVVSISSFLLLIKQESCQHHWQSLVALARELTESPTHKKGWEAILSFPARLETPLPHWRQWAAKCLLLTKRHKSEGSLHSKAWHRNPLCPSARHSLYLPNVTRCTTWRCSFCPLRQHQQVRWEPQQHQTGQTALRELRNCHWNHNLTKVSQVSAFKIKDMNRPQTLLK